MRSFQRAMWVVAVIVAAATVDAAAVRAAGTGGDTTLSGIVTDAVGTSLANVEIAIQTSSGAEVATATTGDGGTFQFRNLAPTTYVVTASRDGFARRREVVRLPAGHAVELSLRLDLQGAGETVTVTPARGDVRQTNEVPESVTVTGGELLSRRNFLTLPQALREEAGVHVQQTTTSQGSPFIRGLTGQYVVNLIDGVRFNNATFRPGANQYTALIEPFFVGQVEIVRGPASAQYGSDALGGTVNVVTGPLGRGGKGGRVHGRLSLAAGSADRSAGGGGEFGLGGHRWGMTFGATGRGVGDLRTGGGIDSHSVATRLLGLPSSVLGRRLAQTSYSQFGGHGRLVFLPSPADVVTVSVLHGVQLDASRYDQLDGGAGNLVGGFDPQVLDFGVARYERMGLGVVDSLSISASFNGQRDDRTSQSINNAKLGPRSKIIDEYNRDDVVGLQAHATGDVGRRQRVVVGAELYDEHVASRRDEASFSAASGGFTDVAAVRARFPNGARYRAAAAFAHDTVALVPDRVLAVVGARYSAFRYAQAASGNPVLGTTPSVPDFSTSFGDVTWNTGVVWTMTPRLVVSARAGRGFRAPNVNDFGSIGLSGLGFEVAPDEGVRAGARAARLTNLAVSEPVQQVGAEVLHGYEVGLKLSTRTVSAAVSAFHSEISSFIERRALIMPAGAVGSLIGGQPILRQGVNGEVFTGLASSAVIVRANGGHIRLQGLEGRLTATLLRDVQLRANVSYVRGTDRETGLPPELENGMPPTHGYVGATWSPAARPWWAEAYALFAFEQDRLSANDLSQARIGGTRTSQEIRDFFANGAVLRGLVRNGVLVATGETVDQVIQRVIGPDVSARVPMFTSNAGYAVLSVRGGYRFTRLGTVTLIIENLLDRNYRPMGSGVDGPGFGVTTRYSVGF